MSERLLRLRKEASKKRPKFNRQETWKLKKFKNNPTWRKPRGHSSKMRRKLKGKTPLVSIGYRGPKDVRNYHPCGLPETYVSNISQIDGVKESIIRIASSVGTRKKIEMVLKTKELNLKVANPKVKFVYVDSVATLERFEPIKEFICEYRLSKVDDDIQKQIMDRADELNISLEEGA